MIFTDYIINGRKPERFFHFFEQISTVPRGSGNEAGIADFLCNFAQKRGLECYRDDANNVFIKCAGTGKFKDAAPVLLQGHTDMVCEKNLGTEHDFLREGLRLRVTEDGKYLYADGTTLGADDGVAVATMLTVLDGELAEHPPLECLFTASEEIGLIGAGAFDYSKISARTMINMDTAEDYQAVVGCAGGIRSELDGDYITVPFSGKAIKIKISGLCGGHSGECINLGRSNGNKLMGRLLMTLYKDFEYNLIEINGGSKDNAIVRECVAVIVVNNTEYDAAKKKIAEIASTIAIELCDDDKGFKVECSEGGIYEEMIGYIDSKRMVYFINTVATDVLAMSRFIPGLVEYSRNLGVIRTNHDKNLMEFVFSSRSAIEGQLDYSTDSLDALGTICGFNSRHYSRYPGWSFTGESELCDKYKRVYKEIFGEDALLTVIHAGLECGIIKSKIPDMDIIAIGPNEHEIHSPGEKLDLDSCEKFWRVVAGLLS